MPKKKREHMNVWEWLLNMGPLKAGALLNLIGAVILSISITLMSWWIDR